jgi:hypothetical protein
MMEVVDIPHRTAAQEIEGFRAPGEGAVKYILTVADLFPERVGDCEIGDLQQLFRLFDREGLEDQRIDEAEERRRKLTRCPI